MKSRGVQVTFSTLSTELKSRGLMSDDGAGALEESASSLFGRGSSPWYINMLSGTGAVIATFFFIGFVFAALAALTLRSEFVFKSSLVFIGAAAMLAGTRIHRKKDRKSGQVFLSTMSFSCVIIGMLMFAAGFGLEFENSWGVTVSFIAASLFLWYEYPAFAVRFVSALSVLISLQVSLYFDFGEGRAADITSVLLMLGETALIAGVFTSRRPVWRAMPVAYAAVCSLLGRVVILSSTYGYTTFHAGYGYIAYLLSMAFAAGVFVSASWASARNNGPALGTVDRALLVAGLLALALLKVQGVLLAVMLLVLGHAGRDRVLRVLGLLLLPVYLWLYYYSLELTLLQKSGALVLGGLVLLAGSLYMRMRHGEADE